MRVFGTIRGLGFGVLMAAVMPSAAAAQSFSNATAITITDCPNPCPANGQAASLYPSPIVVSGVAGVVQRVSITLNGYSHAFPADTDFLLVSPSGRKAVLMSDFGAGSPGVSNVNVTLDDYAARPIPSTVTGNTGVPFVTGNYRPANSGTTDIFPAPAPGGPYQYALSAFNGDSPNGTWNLYIIDDANLDGGSLSGGWNIRFDVRPPPPAPGDLLISEFRTRGLGTTPPGSDGAADEFIELYNNTNDSITLIDAVPGADPTSGSGAGWRLSVVQGGTEVAFQLLSQTSSTAGPLAIAPRGYLLVATQPTTPSPTGNTYTLSTYPTGTGFTASGGPNIFIDPASPTVGFMPDDAGIALFSQASAASARRLDSVGFSSVSHSDYKEGSGLAPAGGITTASNHSWVRRALASTGYPQDTNDNAADFVLVETSGASLNGVTAILGAPGPQRGHTMTSFTTSSSPMHVVASTLASAPIDPEQPWDAAPNLVSDATPVVNGANGTLKIRRRYTNNSGKALIALRFRVIDISTLTGGAVTPLSADLRLLSSPPQTITLTDSSTVSAQALTLQTPPAQANGGGLNSSVSAGVVTTTAPLANGASIAVEFNLGVQVDGAYRFSVIAEGDPADGLGGASAVDVFPEAVPANLAITKTNDLTSIDVSPVTYTIVASNPGSTAVSSATVTDTLPAALSDATWTCTGAGGGTCTASGSGNLNDIVNLPVGASVTYILTATLSASATGQLVNTATVTLPEGFADSVPADNSATDSDNIAVTGGACGVASSGSPTANKPTVNLCATGSATAVSGTSTWEWGCNGMGGGTSTAANACSAPYGEQTISALAADPDSLEVGGGNATLSASSSGSANPVIFTTTTTDICTVSGDTVTPVATGTCVVKANKAAITDGDSRYSAAPEQSLDITINPAGGGGGDGGGPDSGCSCRGGPASATSWLALLALVMWRRMRRPEARQPG